MEKERTSPWLILFRVVFTAALIACIMFIFRNSLENGAQSSARSQAVMQLVNSALAKVHLGPLSEHLIRKLAHFSEFALEGFLLMLCIRVYTKHFVRRHPPSGNHCAPHELAAAGRHDNGADG